MKNEKFGAEDIYLAPETNNLEEALPVQEARSKEVTTEDVFVMAETKPKGNARVSEILDLRDSNRKVFRMADGSEQAVFYPETVHVFNGDTRTFDNVENAFVEEEDGNHFVNGKSHFVARFSREVENDELFTIESGMHRVTVSARKNKNQKNKGVMPKLHKKTASADADKDLLIFEDVQAGADYAYSVTGNGVKEDIVVKEKANVYCYAFVLHQENVSAEFDEINNRVAFISNETGKEVFFIPAPFMTDADGAISTAVSYEVRNLANGDAVLNITADSEWINAEDRNFPVTIDPQIQLSDSAAMTTYSWADGYLFSRYEHCVGAGCSGDGDCNSKRMYMTLKMPTLPRNPRIKKAELVFTQREYNSANCEHPKFGLYRVQGGISTGWCTPINDADLIDFAQMQDGQDLPYTFDVTTLLDQFNKGEISSCDLVLKLLDESATCDTSLLIYGSTCGMNTAPQLVVSYESTYGVNTSYRTHTHSLGRFGQGSIDLQCGNLMFESEDVAWAGNRMPVTIKHLYNSALRDTQYTAGNTIQLNTADFSSMKIGYGFKLNIMQSMKYVEALPIAWTDEEKEAEKCGKKLDGYIYIDENGNETYFKDSRILECCDDNSQCEAVYKDVDGGDMLYYPEKRTLMQGDDTYLFDATGRLIKITDAFNNHMVIIYTAGKITSVLDGAGREFHFTYLADGSLQAVTAPDGETEVTYAYSGNLLSAINYPDGSKAKITYVSNKPTAVTLLDVDGKNTYKVAYSYVQDRISRVTEYGVENNEFVIGAKSDYSYSAASGRTVVQTTEQMDEEDGECYNNVIKTVYTFDDEGNVISEYVYSEDTGNVGAEGEESGINPHAGDGGAGVVSNINNLLSSHSFSNLDDWPEMLGNCDDFTRNSTSGETRAKFGKGILLLRTNVSDCTEQGVYQDTNTLPAGHYTFSAYLCAFSDIKGDNNPGAYIRVVATDGTVLAQSEHIAEFNSEHVRLIAPFEIPSAQSVQVQILLDGEGLVYASAAQLENNPYANAYNMLENGNFERDVEAWEPSANVSISTSTRFNMSKSLMFQGDLRTDCYACQDVQVKSYPHIRETFVLSGWAKGYGIVNHEREGLNTPKFQLRAEIVYMDKTIPTETYIAEFSPCTEEWQLASVEFAKSRYAKVDKIRVFCDYGYNFGTAYFDDIQLVRKSIETGLAESDFVVETNGENAEVENGEDIETTEDTAPAFEEHRDQYGNALTETTFADGEFGTIYRAFKYNEDCNCFDCIDAGNDLVEETDARGNTTSYTVDCVTSRNEEVIDRCGNKTAYEYDNAGRTTKVTSKIYEVEDEDHRNPTVSYTYDTFDNMTEIVRGDGMKYVLAYNEFHNLESIGVDGENEKLVQYSYKTGNGRLKAITYANGDTMKASYNSIGQMIAEKWFDKDSVLKAHYKYTYDGQGNIVRSIDMLAKKEYNYEYEEGRILRATEANVVFSGEMVVGKTLVNEIRYFYDAEGTMTKKVVTPVGGAAQTIYYESTDDNTVVKFMVPDPKVDDPDHMRAVVSHSKTDSFGRKVFDELQLGTGFVSRQFQYHAGEVTQEHVENGKLKSTPTTQLVSRITFADDRTLDYEYDAEERITSVVETYKVNEQTFTNTTLYTYDALGQLLTETVNDTLVNVMTYDDYGNIRTKNGVVYAYKPKEEGWSDLLIKVGEGDDRTITYDAQGNPIKYLGHTLTWEKGRQLKEFVKVDETTISYTYNANGIRTSKTVAGVKHDYILDGTKILREGWNYDEETKTYQDVLIPLYDNEDSVCGIIYNGEPYYFQKNLQGDVIAITNENGGVISRYSYDAWGANTGIITCAEPTDSVDIANINPFRYRGYYFDKEIEMYYLQSRYYDPQIKRFINADAAMYIGCGESIASYNICIYCENNCVNFVDDYGHVPSNATLTRMHDRVLASAQLFLFAVGIITSSEVNTCTSSGRNNGRMDIYSYIDNQVWEVKRKNSNGRSAGNKQLNTYTQSYVQSLYHTWFRIKRTPREGNCSVYGTVVVSDYVVIYHSQVGRPALILYDYMSLEDAAKLCFTAVTATSAIWAAKFARFSAKAKRKGGEALAYIRKAVGNVKNFTKQFMKSVADFLKKAGPIVLTLIALLILAFTGVLVPV